MIEEIRLMALAFGGMSILCFVLSIALGRASNRIKRLERENHRLYDQLDELRYRDIKEQITVKNITELEKQPGRRKTDGPDNIPMFLVRQAE